MFTKQYQYIISGFLDKFRQNVLVKGNVVFGVLRLFWNRIVGVVRPFLSEMKWWAEKLCLHR